jgi:peptidoglycan/xylan/chitin deacetylase (PgdA/CDA1 family)/glycosyltransferase involved in cell wall biosynthesis
MKPSPKISVVIPTYNRRDLLVSRSLPPLFNQDLPPDEYEIVVVVDGSTDGTIEALEAMKPRCTLRIIHQPNCGWTGARHTGIKEARSDLILFVDDDIVCNPDLLRQHVAAHTGPDPVVAHGPIYVAPDSPASIVRYVNESWYRNYYGRIESQGGLKFPQDDYLASNTSLPRATLLASGGFDEHLGAKEDYELGLRLWKMGIPFQYLPKAVAHEFFAKRTMDVLYKDGKIYGRAEVLLCRKHPDYRPLSGLATMAKASWGSRLRQQIYARSPVSPVHLLTLPLWVCDRLCRFPTVQRVGQRLLGIGRGIVEIRSATREAGSWKALQREFGVRLPVLLYHHIGPLRPGVVPGLTITPAVFERQVRWMARKGYTGICPADWVRWRCDGKDLPAKPVLLTFDDGYTDLVEHALPVLRRYGFGAVVFIVTGLVGRTNAWDEAHGWGTLNLMTAEQIRHWATQGIEFGAHTRTHTDLTTLPADKMAEEVVGSRDDLARITGAPVTSFAYPYGYYNQTVNDCARGAYSLTFRADEKTPGINYLCTDPHDVQRTLVLFGDLWADLECRLRWGHTLFVKLRSRLQVRSRFKRAVHFIFGRRKP